MNVRSLLIRLSTMDPDMEVVIDTEARKFECHLVSIEDCSHMIAKEDEADVDMDNKAIIYPNLRGTST